MSKTARRNVRQAVALAAELNLHSVALYGVVWTLHHPKQQQQQELKAEPATSTGCKSASHSRRADKSAARLEDFQTAKRFRIGSFFRRWQQSIRPKPPLQALPPPSTTTFRCLNFADDQAPPRLGIESPSPRSACWSGEVRG